MKTKMFFLIMSSFFGMYAWVSAQNVGGRGSAPGTPSVATTTTTIITKPGGSINRSDANMNRNTYTVAGNRAASDRACHKGHHHKNKDKFANGHDNRDNAHSNRDHHKGKKGNGRKK